MSTQSIDTIDDLVEAYESAREQAQRVSLLDFLPAPSSDWYETAAVELIRVDMEYSWNRGDNYRIAHYQKLLPDLFQNDELLAEVAFEEYRLRVQAGEHVDADEYRFKFGISTGRWARLDPNVGGDCDAASPSSIPQLWDEALELASDVQAFPAIGESFLGFSLFQEIGRGAFSHVFLARQDELADRPVVLKIASGSSLEPQHLARLQHTNIVPIYSVHCRENLTAVCMPYFGRRTLADLLAVVRQERMALSSPQNLISTFLGQSEPTELAPNRSSNSEPQRKRETSSDVLRELAKTNYVDAVLWVMKQATDGLAHAHQRGIVHRDLKPANVLLTDEGRPMLLDFNLSENVVVNGRASLLVGGTLPYMAPEQLAAVRSGGRVAFPADIFSQGVIFFELLTGQQPFADRRGAFDDVVQEMIADREEGYPSVRSLNSAIPRAVESIVSRCLAPNPEHRYAHAGELAEDLEKQLRSEPLVHAPDRSFRERGRKWLKRHPRISSAAGVAALAGCALFVLLGLWTLRGQRLDRLEAETKLQEFRENRPPLHMALGVPPSDSQILHDSIEAARRRADTYRVLDDPDWRESKAFSSLTRDDQRDLQRELAELLFLIARAHERLSVHESATAESDDLVAESFKFSRMAGELYSPDSRPQALLQLQASLHGKLGQPERATALLEQLQMNAGQTAIDEYAEAYDLLTDKKYQEVEPLLISLRDRNPTDPLAWLLLGDVKVALHQVVESEGCFTTAIALERNSYLAYIHRGRCRMDLKRHGEAAADFERVIAMRPLLACGYLNRALCQRMLGNHQDAIDDLTKALELGATQTRIYFLRSQLRQRVGDKTGAKEDLEAGLALTPTDELSWVSRGTAKINTDPEAALADFRQALQMNPASVSALRSCTHVLADRLDRPAEALDAINQRLKLNERDAEALAGRAVLRARAGDREAALADVQRLLRMSDEPQALFQGACALSLTSKTEPTDAERALTLLARAVQLEPRWLVRAQTDPDLNLLRETTAFQEFAANSQKIHRMKAHPNNGQSE
ncbi:protein kinase [Pirellulales bacterium]|nr:protein kinase [Pirellulales bacterium]